MRIDEGWFRSESHESVTEEKPPLPAHTLACLTGDSPAARLPASSVPGGAMRRTLLSRILFATALFLPVVVLADPAADLSKSIDAFQHAKSWHAEEHFSNGRTVEVDFVAPDRWRVEPSPKITELVIGKDIYMVRNGHVTRLPFGGGMIRKMVKRFSTGTMTDEMRRSVRDLGMQTLQGRPVHVYSYTSQNIPETVYIGSDHLPVQAVIHDKKHPATIIYSKFNAPISIQP